MLPGRSAILRFAFFCCAVAVCAPAVSLGATLSATPDNVTFTFSPPASTPAPVYVTVSASDGSTPAITVSVAAGPNTPSGLFPTPPVSGLTFQVGIDPNTLNTVVAKGPGLYTATVTVSASGFAPLTIPVSLTVSLTSSIIASPTSLNFAPGGANQQTISLTGNGGPNISFTATAATASGGGWLSVSSNADYTPATLTVTVNPLILSTGVYSGSITITPPSPGIPFAIPVNLQVGTDALTATPTSFSFSYTQGSTVPPAQTLQLSSILPKDTFTAQATSTGNWLLVNGVSTVVTGALPATLNITVNPGTLAPGTYTGSIAATDSANNSQTVTATLVVSGISGVANPTTLVFVGNPGGTPPAPQTVVINGFGASSFTATVSGSWLSISAASGPAPNQITVSANTTGLSAGTYTGNIVIDLNTHIQTIYATLILSTEPVLSTNPGDLIFYYSGTSGGAPVPSQSLTVNTTGEDVSFTWAPDVPAWLQIGPSGTLIAPQVLSIGVNAQPLPNGFYFGQVILTPAISGSPSTIVPVMLTVTNNPAVNVSTTSMTFSGSAGGAAQSQTLNVSAISPLAFSVTPATNSGGNWLSVSPGSAVTGSGNTPITVTADPSGLTAGTYSGTLTLTTLGGVVTTVAVTFNVGASTTPFTIAPTSLSFAYEQNGPAPATQTVSIAGGQSYTANATTVSGGSWLSVTPTTGTGNGILTVSVNPATLPAGTYTGTVAVTPAGGTPQDVTVTLNVMPAATLSATPNPIAFTYVAGNPAPAPQTLSVVSSGSPIAFKAAASSSGWLSVTPTAGTTPSALTLSANTTNLGAGSYSGTVSLSDNNGNLLFTVNVTLTVTASLPSITRVVNAASFSGTNIAPGEIVVVFGSGLGPTAGVTAAIDSKGFIESSLANVKVTFNGYAAPLLYVSAGQINAIVPYEMAGATDASVEVIFGSARSNSVSLPVVTAAPGIFSVSQSGTGDGAILDANYHVVSASNPVSAGSVIQIFATGQGQTNPAGVDGLIEPDALPLPAPQAPAAVTIGGLGANIQYVGAAPGLVAGALQVNVVVPPGLPSGPAQVMLSFGGYNSPTGITVAIQ